MIRSLNLKDVVGNDRFWGCNYMFSVMHQNPAESYLTTFKVLHEIGSWGDMPGTDRDLFYRCVHLRVTGLWAM